MNARADTPEAEAQSLRVPPSSVEAEQSLLGALLLDNDAFGQVAHLVSAGSFYRQEHGAIFTAIAGLLSTSKPADVVTVFESLLSSRRGASADDMAYLNSLAACTPGSRNAARHAEIVREKALHRALIAAADNASALAWQPGPVGEKLDAIAASFSQLERGTMRKAPRVMADLVADALGRLSAAAEGREVDMWPTGVAPLDQMLLGGLRPGKFYGIAARPSVGKSSAARAIALGVARAGQPVLLLSQEMPVEEVADCVLAQLGSIDNGHLQTGRLTDEDWSRLSEAADAAARLPLHVDDEGGLTIADIRSKSRSVKGLKVLVLDYLQLSSSTLRNATTNDQIAEISKGLKRLALELGIAVVVLSQLNRDVERRGDKEPKLSDLRDSGAIEQDLDVAVLLWTAEDESKDNPSRLVGWKVDKHRGGPKGRFAMRFVPSTYTWRESREPLRRTAVNSLDGGFE